MTKIDVRRARAYYAKQSESPDERTATRAKTKLAELEERLIAAGCCQYCGRKLSAKRSLDRQAGSHCAAEHGATSAA